MLGEDHTLTHDFPQYEDAINKLIESDPDFVREMKAYNALDKEIRTLELQGNPIDDDEMHKLKTRRAAMKDDLYSRLSVNG